MSQNKSDGNRVLLEALAAAEEAIGGKQYSVSTVVERIRQAANQYPHDGAIRTLQFVVEKRASQAGPLDTISQAEFSELHQQVSGLGKAEAFEESLGDLLLTGHRQVMAHTNEQFIAGLRDSGNPLDIYDANKAEELYGLFDETSVKAARGSFVDNGRRGVAIELASMGFTSPSVEVVARNQDFVIYAAEADSPHGRMNAYIPAEIKLGSVLMPSVFVSGNEFRELNKENLTIHAYENVMGKRTADPQSILNTLDKLAGKQDTRKTALASEAMGDIPLAVPELYRELVDEPEPFVVMPKVALPKALEHLTEGMIRDSLAEAGLSFDRSVVVAAKSTVENEIRASGVQCNKVAIASEFEGGLMVAAHLVGKGGHKTIEVPVEIFNGRVMLPSVFVSGGMVEKFEAGSLRAFASDDAAGSFNAILSDQYGMSFKDLHGRMLRSAAYGKFVEAEEALAVIADQFGAEFHKVAHDSLMGLLNVGFGPEEKPIDAMDRYLKEAVEAAASEDNRIHVSASVRMLYPEA